jgi:hypothetical protein
VFLSEAVRQFLQAETGKTYNNVIVREYIIKAIPEAKAVKQLRLGNDHIRPWALANIGKWDQATNDELRAELKTA